MVDSLVVCPNCQGTGHDWDTTINPSDRPYKVECPTCFGQGAYDKNEMKKVRALDLRFFDAYDGSIGCYSYACGEDTVTVYAPTKVQAVEEILDWYETFQPKTMKDLLK